MPSDGTLNKILRYGILGGIFLVPFVPLVVVSTMYFPFITGKNFAFRVLVEVLFGGWLILAFRDPAYRPRFSLILGAFGALVVIAALADIFGIDPLRSFWSNFERMDGLVTQLHLFAYFLIAGSVLKTPSLWWRFANVALGVSVFVSLYALLQMTGVFTIHQGSARVDSTLGNATYLAMYLLFMVFLAVFLWIRRPEHHRWLAWVYGAATFLLGFVIINTATRGVVLGLTGGIFLGVLLFAWFHRGDIHIRRWSLGVLIAIVTITGTFIILRDTDFVRGNTPLRRLADISLEAGSSRFNLWSLTWEGVKERPLLGWGQDNFMYLFSKYYTTEMRTEEPWFDRAHNVVFDWLVSAGFLGLFAYLSVISAVLFYVWFYRRTLSPFTVNERIVLSSFLAAYLFQNLFVFDTIVSYIFLSTFLAFVHERVVRNKDGNAETRPNRILDGVLKRGTFPQVIPALIIVATFFVVYAANAGGIRTASAIIDGLNARALEEAQTPEAQQMALKTSIDSFERAVSQGFLGRMEAREQLALFTNQLRSFPQQFNDLRNLAFTLAEKELRQEAERSNGNVRYMLFLASLYNTYFLYDKAIPLLEDARNFMREKTDIYYMLASAYLSINNTKEALVVAREAFDLDQTDGRARQVYIAAAVYAGEFALADTLSRNDAGNIYIPDLDPIVISAYASVKKFDRVALLWEQAIATNPKNVQYHISLAAAYVELGRRTDAIRELEKAAELEPRFKEQAAQWIAIIRAGGRP